MNALRVFVVMVGMLALVSLASAKEAVPLADDPELEKQVNEITAELRCLVCQNQTIADSHADLAIDLKNQVREMVKSGKTQKEINDYMVQRYGDFVLYRPAMKPSTMLLWAGPFILLVIGLTVLVINLRKRRALVKDEGDLSTDEQQRLKTLLAEQRAEEEKS
ncbi:MAG TPA: cytochrome c-type biogenesis protein CcmH [Gammaproteobacteria bacterium]|nr:cytochrome c-type biogenesis protein CcmH [Gammaproteobacteria bacterium]